jgi:L-cystine transport system substrate-binding protein
LTIVFALVLTGCNFSTADNFSGADVRTIKVVGLANNIPFVHADEDGNMTGYEIEVLKKIDELLPQYQFEYSPLDFTALSQALESESAQIAVCMLVKSEERQEKFIFPNEYSTLAPIYGLIKEGRTDIQTIDDLSGKKLFITPTGYEYNVVLKWNEANPDKDPIIIDPMTEANQNDAIPKIANGADDIMFMYKQNFEYIKSVQDLTGIELSPPLIVEDTYFMLGKKETQLRDDIDGALKTLKEDGTLSKLSKEILGEDVFDVYGELFEAQGKIK